ncbi:ABC transporter ATP-binding protein [Olsenella sp. YH-ols2217]|uniref:ABC transporter ATP-binding protein n=1 Tax=Kribbibacterium absianum TaxID=3044210 RepID=A0ABT6ZHY3_9ACTN|nr:MULTISPECIES: ABC transporter ATP-binding protein [unclassified Olsenella]MDJ1121172.1 ABC transporter ATP-binding protein [Olsenella sp. YH-ols2216]MDJ1128663.1 ABC transporter ATP-binding protein [Olsenella sp. YH-ols2217]
MQLIARFVRPHLRLLVVTLLLLTVDVACALYVPTLAAQIMNLGAAGASVDEVVATGAWMLVSAVVSGAGAVAGAWCCARLVANVGHDLRCAIYEKSLKLSVYDFRHFGTASITTRTIADVTNIQSALMMTVQMILPVPIVCFVALGLAFSVSVRGALMLLAAVAVVLAVALLVIRQASPLFRRLQYLLDRMSAVLLENLTGVRVVRAFNREDHERGRLDVSFEDYAQTAIKANRLFANLDGLSYFATNGFVVVLYWMSGAQIVVGGLGIGDILALIEYAVMVLMYIMMAQMVVLMLPRALECCRRVDEVLQYAPEICDLVAPGEGAKPLLGPAATAEDVPVLAFDDVSFRFADAEEDALTGLTFACRAGETLAIIGGTGSGKSTIASLILRFNEVSAGSVRLGGVDVRDMTQHELREHIGFVQQKAWLASGTIRSNLLWGDSGASDEDLWHALEVAQAAGFVRELPEGLDARVAAGGTNFSGGQRQRLAIARALVGNPALYVFDDSFSALDFKTDAALRHALAQEVADAAQVIVAQRVSTIRHADSIVVVDEGRIVGQGTHEELMDSCAVYREIVASQTKEVSE